MRAVLIALVLVFALHTVIAGDAPQKIVPDDWEPLLFQVVRWLKQDFEQTKAQQGMNLLSRNIADVKNAELFVLYIRLFERLNATDRDALRRDQEKWLKARSRFIDDSIESRGGTLAPLEANEADIKFTDQRIEELKKRLSALEKEKHE